MKERGSVKVRSPNHLIKISLKIPRLDDPDMRDTRNFPIKMGSPKSCNDHVNTEREISEQDDQVMSHVRGDNWENDLNLTALFQDPPPVSDRPIRIREMLKDGSPIDLINTVGSDWEVYRVSTKSVRSSLFDQPQKLRFDPVHVEIQRYIRKGWDLDSQGEPASDVY